MSLKIRFRFDGRCSTHPRYNPEKDSSPQHKDCPGCDALWVIHLYTGIARRKAESGEGILVSRPDPPSDSADQPPSDESSPPSSKDQRDESPDRDTASAD
jgi:hypothetical protein